MPISGFPDATNTGVPPGVTLTASGGLVINTPGVVIEGLDIRGMVTINADNVTLRNCRISSDSWAVVNITSGSTGVVVENCEINGLSGEGTRGISGQGTFLRNNIHHTEDGIYILGSNTLIQDNYIHDLQSNWSGPHYDGIATDGGVSNIIIRHNTVINPHGQTSALMLSNYFGSVSNVVVDNNWLEGGGYTVYSDGQFKGGTISGVSFTNNYLVEGEYGYSSIRNNTPVWQGNIEYTGQVPGPTAPSAPTIVSFSDDTGASSTDRITNDTTLRLSGTAAANGVVNIYDGANLLGTTTAGAGGTWTFTTAALANGAHNLTATTTTSSGTSTRSSALSVQIDTVAAAPTIATPTVSANGTVTLTGQAEIGSVVRVYDGQTQIGTVIATNGTWSYTTAALAVGAHTLTAQATDVAGNASAASAPVTATIVGTPQIPLAPAIVSFSDDTGASSTDRITNDTTLRLSGTAAANGVVSIYDGANLLGTTAAGAGGLWNFTTAALLDGSHNLTARVTNLAGHTSNASSTLAVTIDTTAPTVPTIGSTVVDGAGARSVAGSTAALASDDVTLNGRAEANSTVRVYDGNNEIGSVRADASGAWTYTASDLSDGTHSFTSRSVDAAGNASARSAALQVTIDTHTEAPEVAFTSVAQNWNDRVVLRGTADPNDRITIFDNGGTQALGTTTVGADGRWTLTTPCLSDDVVHRFTAAVTDSSGRTISTSTAVLGTDRDNRLMSTSGDDLFRGNGGHDTFVFAANFGHDTIVDFGAGRRSSDVVQFSRSVFDDFAAVLSHATQHGQDVVIDAGGGNTLTLRNTSLSSLDRSDFHFA
jgi:hypothetical protein